MLADLILAVIERRARVFVDYSDNLSKRQAHIRRSAAIHAADPLDYERRFLAGRAIQRDIWLTGEQRRARKLVPILRLRRA